MIGSREDVWTLGLAFCTYCESIIKLCSLDNHDCCKYVLVLKLIVMQWSCYESVMSLKIMYSVFMPPDTRFVTRWFYGGCA